MFFGTIGDLGRDFSREEEPLAEEQRGDGLEHRKRREDKEVPEEGDAEFLLSQAVSSFLDHGHHDYYGSPLFYA